LDHVHQKEECQSDLERESEIVADPRNKGPNAANSDNLKQLNGQKSAHLGVFGGVEERESHHHCELFVVGKEVKVVRSEPVTGRPPLMDLSYHKGTSYSE